MYKPSNYMIKVRENKDKTTVFNSKTGEILRLSKDVCSVLQQPDMDWLSSGGYLKFLLNHKLCVPQSMNETEQFLSDARHQLREENQYCIAYTIAVTTQCNLYCPYCFEREVPRENMSLRTAQAVVDFILDSAARIPNLKFVELKWFGGEPLLAMPVIELIADEVTGICSQRGIRCETRIITNGTLLTEENVETLLRYNLKSLHISMDGDQEAYCHYKNATPQTYWNVMDAIHNYCDKININIRLNCHKGNFQSILKLTDILYSDKKIRNHVYLYLARIVSDQEEIKVFTQSEFMEVHLDFLQHLYELGWHVQIKNALPVSRTIPCGIQQRNNYTIDSRGQLYHCEKLVGQAEKCVGSCFEPKKISDAPGFDPLTLSARCNACPYLPVCFDGCPQNEEETDCTSVQNETLEILRLIDRVSY